MKSAPYTQSFGLFMILLVLTMPFYSAQAMAASVRITRNTGGDGVANFIDGNGDTWVVDAVIRDAPLPVAAENVKLKIGRNEQPFTSCTENGLETTCSYVSPLPDGVNEGTFRFQVNYPFVNQLNQEEIASALGDINVDRSNPTVVINRLEQRAEGKLFFDFTASDQITAGKPAVGLKEIRIIDAESSAVVFSINDQNGLTLGSSRFDFLTDGVTQGLLPISLQGEGTHTFRVVAEDQLGHQGEARKSINVDFAAPDIRNFNFTSLKEFIGEEQIVSDMSLFILEKNGLSPAQVLAFSNDADLVDKPAARCQKINREDNLWQCTWDGVSVKPSANVEVSFKAMDSFGNTAEKTLSNSFTSDTVPPRIISFATERTFGGTSYVKSNTARYGKNKLFLSVAEEVAGIEKDDIRLNINAFGGDSSVPPNECVDSTEGKNCFWELGGAVVSPEALVSFTRFQDKVGNEGGAQELKMKVDETPPRIQEFKAFGVSEAGVKDYFQSQDKLRLEFMAEEDSGLTILVYLKWLVDNAELNHPETSLTEHLGDGWQVFTEDACVRDEKNEKIWKCVVETESLKSGIGNDLDLRIRIRDTAGNEAEQWPEPDKIKNVKGTSGENFKFRLLGLTAEESPDHWDTGTRTNLLPFIDLDVVKLFPARMPVEVRLKRTTATAEILNLELPEGACQAKEGQEHAPEINRNLIIKRVTPDGSDKGNPTIVLEFKTFDPSSIVKKEGEFKEREFEYTCQLLLFSKVGRDAVRAAEIQDVPVTVKFAYSVQGALDETIDAKVQELKDDVFFKIANSLSVLNDILKWIKFVVDFVTVITALEQIVSLVRDEFRAVADVAENTVVGGPVGAALRGACIQVAGTTKVSWEFLKVLQVPAMIFSCNPNAFKPAGLSEGDKGSPVPLNFVYWWQNNILTAYNIWTLREFVAPAESLYENMYLSAFGLCVPGIIFNIEKARELQCRRIVCYQKEVPAGIATFDACDKLHDLQMCEFVFGPLFEIALPGLAVAAYLGKLIKSALQSPLGLINIAELFLCDLNCFVPAAPGLVTACKVARGIQKGLGIIDTIAGAIQSPPSVTESPYCSQVENMEDEKEKKQEEVETPQPEVQTQG